jgi:hypothetical protein
VYFVPPPGGSADGGEQDLNEEISTILLQVASKLTEVAWIPGSRGHIVVDRGGADRRCFDA